jgi:hypothetical protein
MKNIIVLVLFSCSLLSFAAQPVITQQQQQDTDVRQKSSAVCDSYDSCLEQGLKERSANVDSVLLYYTDGKKEMRYNLFDNISVKFSQNVCPPMVSVYKMVNNVNYLMDVFATKEEGTCIAYIANITGDGRSRDFVTGQLEIKFCTRDEMFESCDQGIVYAKTNMFGNKKERIQDSPDSGRIQNNLTPYIGTDYQYESGRGDVNQLPTVGSAGVK